MDINELKDLIKKINDGNATKEEEDMVCNELIPKIKELNSLMEKLLIDITRAKISG
jgi:hypothetical protein